ncbi:MAG TPA: PKD domain-containing protein [Chitinophagales bacterium]|nr:PKD domain-containing protein [Chitinophagales bacterium]
MHKSIIHILLTLAVFIYKNTLAQSVILSPCVSPSTGGNAISGGIDLSWSLGESFTPTLVSGGTMLSQGFQQPEVEIVAGTITVGPVCNDSAINIPFTAFGIIEATNVFTAQLSDATGSFSTPANIGSSTGNTSGVINGVIPSGTPAGTGYKVRVVSSLPAYEGKSNVSAITIIACGNQWLGYTTDWFSGTNWSVGTSPNNCNSDAVIPTSPLGGFFPNLNNGSAQVRDITVQQGATITIDASHSLSVCGNWTGGNTGTSTIAGGGIVVLTSTSAQLISGQTQFTTLRVNKSSGTVTLQASAQVSVLTALELENGNLSSGTGMLILKSSATDHAIFNDFGATYGTYHGTFTGTIYEERYYTATSANSYNQHYMGSPVSNAGLAQFGAGTVSGAVTPTVNCDETQLDATSIYGNVFTYNEAIGNLCPLMSWTVAANNSNATPGKGYSVARTGTGVLTVSGSPNVLSSYTQSGLQNSNWTKGTLQHPSSTAYTSGWHMISNPYNASLDFTSVNTPQPGFDLQIQIWDVIQGQYFTATKIAPFQAFFIHKNNNPGNDYVIDGTKRVVTPHTFYAQNAPEHLTITATNNANTLHDITTVGFSASATTQFDEAYDANKLTGSLGRHNLYTTNNGYWLNKNILQSIAQTSTVDMGFEPGATGSYTLNFAGLSSFDPTSYITLEDKKLNMMYDVRRGNYNFTADAADDWNRFALHFTPPAHIAINNQNCDVLGTIHIEQPGTANWAYTLADANSAVVSTGNLNQSTPADVNVSGGTYTLTLVDSNNYTVIKTITVEGTQPVAATSTVTAAQVETADDITFTNITPNATTTIWNFGDGTTCTDATATHSYASAGTYTVTLTVTNADGCTAATTQTITVTDKVISSLDNLTGKKPINIWSNSNRVFIDFSKQTNVDATIEIYNILGQQLVNERFTRSTIYGKDMHDIEAAYMLVKVKNDGVVTSKKVFITNLK